ncbi:hypothetical protein L1987_86058 [Smallanthus sonchifolius]|uniref:Uncharacterized protein n=1 Tax=Smallanthus sonchifolius TaxID=185202 RepID=A0ACB8XXJ1_9ASTR|nr:hypothetical protein L1987_86058 [Smallanthus sonchifolius]
METARSGAGSFAQTEISWDKIDKTKFYVVRVGIFSVLTVGLYPISVANTRMQVATKDSVEKNAYAVIRGLLKTEGVRGFDRGMETARSGAGSFAQTEISWDKIDKTKFYVVGVGIFSVLTVGLYPISVVKTRMHVATKDSVEKNAYAVIRGLLKTEGVRVHATFVLNVESQQVSQRLMVQGYSGHERYNGDLDVDRKLLKQDGIRGLYRGFGLSVMTYSPSSAIWWASYGSSQRVLWRLLGHGTEPRDNSFGSSLQGTGGICAAAAASLTTIHSTL